MSKLYHHLRFLAVAGARGVRLLRHVSSTLTMALGISVRHVSTISAMLVVMSWQRKSLEFWSVSKTVTRVVQQKCRKRREGEVGATDLPRMEDLQLGALASFVFSPNNHTAFFPAEENSTTCHERPTDPQLANSKLCQLILGPPTPEKAVANSQLARQPQNRTRQKRYGTGNGSRDGEVPKGSDSANSGGRVSILPEDRRSLTSTHDSKTHPKVCADQRSSFPGRLTYIRVYRPLLQSVCPELPPRLRKARLAIP